MSSSCDILAEMRTSGVELKVESGKLLCRSPWWGEVPDHLRQKAARYRPELMALLTAERGLPPGVRLFFQAENAALCWPEECFLWTWEGAPSWLFASERPLPPCEPSLHPRSPKRCKQCHQLPGLSWQTCANGEKRLRVECKACGAFAGWLKQDPRNPELVWRTPS
jgi:hypothetical protein